MVQPTIAPGRGETWRPMTRREAAATTQCACQGLTQGGCYMRRTVGSVYCYYHDKLARGLIDTILDERRELRLGDVHLTRLRAGYMLVYPLLDSDGRTMVPADEPMTAGQVRQVRANTDADTVLVKYEKKAWVIIEPRLRYPVWPLPLNGYVLLDGVRSAA